MKVGDIFFHCWLYIGQRERSYIVQEEWHVTSINKNGIYLKQKTDLTWGKLSKKHGDFGFLPGPHERYKMVWPINFDTKKGGYSRSKGDAYKTVIPELNKCLRDVERLLKEAKIKSSKQK